MKASPDDIKSLKEKIKTLREQLEQRLQQIENTVGASQFAVDEYKSLLKRVRMPKNVMRMRNVERIKTIYRDLAYINRLRTSTLEGAQKAYEIFNPLMQKLDIFGVDRKEFFKAVSDVYEETSMMMTYKYEIFDVVGDIMTSSSRFTNIEDVVQEIRKAFRKTERDLNKEHRYTDENLKISFTKRLDEIRRKYTPHYWEWGD